MKKSFTILCIFLSMSAYTKVIDNLEDIRAEWVPFSDQVMGGISEVNVYELEEEGTSFYRLEGNVSTENNGGFIQVRAGVNLRNKNIEGIRIKVRGNNNEYFLHLRSPRMLPWNYYSAKFYASQEWMVIDLPLSSFEYSRDSSKSFNSSKIKTIGLVAFGKDFFAQVDLAGVELY
jgi:hypothetical protein